LASLDLTGFVSKAALNYPPYGQLRVLSFIPGFGMDLALGIDGGFFVQNSLCARVKINERITAKAGAGLGVAVSGFSIYVPLVAGAHYFLTDKMAAAGHLTIPLNYPSNLRIIVCNVLPPEEKERARPELNYEKLL